jgi:hypothetical protein
MSEENTTALPADTSPATTDRSREVGATNGSLGRPAPDRTDKVDAADRPFRAGAYEKFGGVNAGAGFFGWLVSVGLTALLTGLVAVTATAIGYSTPVTQTEAQRAAGTVTIAAGIVLLVVLIIGYYAGGYVAGRMSRFDGGRQGLLVWIIGVVVTAVAVVAGWAAGTKYNLLDRVSLPRIPIPHDQLTVGGVIAGVAVLVGTLLAAVAGGKVGRHYHDRVDRAAL